MLSIFYLVSALAPVFALSSDSFDASQYAAEDIINRDVAVIGGGATGIFAAIQLQRQGKTVVVVEKEDSIGGHVNTYIDPQSNIPVDYGVQTFWDIPVTRDYFDYLQLMTKPYSYAPNTTVYADFQSGKKVTGVKQSSNYTAYQAELNKYPTLAYSWTLPQPVPSDLLLPFKDFVAKYDLGDIAYSIFEDGEGANDPAFLDQLTVNVFKMVDNSYFDAATASINPVNGNGDIYAKAGGLLGKDVLISSTVQCARRNGNVSLVVNAGSEQKLVQASKLLISIPPLTANMSPFDLDETESSLFSQWTYSKYYVALVNNTGLPAGYHFSNANSSAATYNIPALPAPYQITATHAPDLFYVWYGSPFDVTESAIKNDISQIVQRLRTTVESNVSTPLNFIEFKNHTPFKLTVPADAVESGFYTKLYALQGHRNTFYTGAALLSHDASELYNFTQQVVLPKLMAQSGNFSWQSSVNFRAASAP